MENFEIIERYILGQLSAEEERKVKERIESDAAFREEYIEIKDLIIAIESKGLRESLKGRKITFDKKKEKKKSSEGGRIISIGERRRRLYGGLAAAATIALLLFFGWWFFSQPTTMSESNFMAEVFYPDPGLPTKMDATDNYAFYDAMIDYKTGDYKKALDKWAEINDGIGKDTLYFYRAMAYQNLSNPKTARDLLKNISDNSPLYPKAQWRILETYLREKDYEKAQDFFNQLPSDIHPAYQEVKTFLKNH